MSIFNLFTLMGGLALFLYGMNLMGESLEQQAGGKLQVILSKLSDNPLKGFLLGLGVTAVIQSSSATTVMVVGFVNSGIMQLHQAVGIIMGSNVGTTVTSWLLSLTGIQGDSFWIKMLKPSSFGPILAFAGIILAMFCKSSKKKDTGMILLGFATLMFGMETMTGAVSGLKDVPGFQKLFLTFTNPALGVLAGAAMNLAILTVVGRCVGAHDNDQVRYYTRKLLKIEYAMMAVVNVVLLAALPLILNLYTLSPASRELATQLIFIHDGFAMLLWPLALSMPNALRAANDVKFTMVLSIGSMVCFRIALSYVVGVRMGYGALGVWFAMLVDWVVRAAVYTWRFEQGKWESMARI